MRETTDEATPVVGKDYNAMIAGILYRIRRGRG